MTPLVVILSSVDMRDSPHWHRAHQRLRHTVLRWYVPPLREAQTGPRRAKTGLGLGSSWGCGNQSCACRPGARRRSQTERLLAFCYHPCSKASTARADMADTEMADGMDPEARIRELASALEVARSDQVKLEIELDSTLHSLQDERASHESALLAETEKLTKEREDGKRKDEELRGLKEEVQRLKKQSEDGTGRDSQMQTRLAEVEKEKRDLLSVIEEREKDNSELAGRSPLRFVLLGEPKLKFGPCL